jgi:two-component system sporulation sensor kinase A
VLFSNVIDNAYQALQHKTGTVTIATTDGAAGEAQISISDTGAGIAHDDLARIAEPFFTRKSRGIGLGLAVCSQIVALHNGTLHFTSEVGVGTTVTIVLPRKRLPASENQ